ncbi:DUF3231 family protein [Salibacterium aidingense]|uniref:DUF3231 family protein n=1 Tax=Salibacterium aidingense TaxID=384933 RepID=UPI0004160E28|nr:DUF3231 family protein [Salibacterium aidingense]
MEVMRKSQMTTAEHSQLWSVYMNASTSSAMLKYFHEKAEDEEISSMLQKTLSITSDHLNEIATLFNQENKPVPIGMTEEDVNIHAPKLYTDPYFLQHVFQLSNVGMFSFSTAISLSVREDIYQFFTNGFHHYNELYQRTKTLLQEKGLYLYPPSIPTLDEVDFVKKQSFLTGWFGERRPLTAVEITHLFNNIQRNDLGVTTLTGFGQAARSKEVKDHIVRGIEMAKKHISIFRSVLEENQIPVPMGSESMVTTSAKEGPFSEKLMLYHVTAMSTLGIGFYGLSISTNIRRDLASHYARLIGEAGLFSEDGVNIMINHGWLEEPPRMVDRRELIKSDK